MKEDVPGIDHRNSTILSGIHKRPPAANYAKPFLIAIGPHPQAGGRPCRARDLERRVSQQTEQTEKRDTRVITGNKQSNRD